MLLRLNVLNLNSFLLPPFFSTRFFVHVPLTNLTDDSRKGKHHHKDPKKGLSTFHLSPHDNESDLRKPCRSSEPSRDLSNSSKLLESQQRPKHPRFTGRETRAEMVEGSSGVSRDRSQH